MQESRGERKVPLWVIAVGSALLALGAGLLLVGWHSPKAVHRPAEPSHAVDRPQEDESLQAVKRSYPVIKRQPVIQETAEKSKAMPVPILMYHEIRKGPNSLFLPEQQLEEQLDVLKREGFEAITLEQLYQAYANGTRLPPHPVVLTFDDGYASFYTNAYPLLKRHGYPATLFVITGSVGKPEYVTWDQVREMAADGIEMGGHTVNHSDLTKLDPSRQSFEAAESRRVLEEQSGRPVRFFAYPAGRFNDHTLAATRQAGYLGAVTTVPGLADPGQDALQWQRIRVNPGITGKALVARIHTMEAAAAAAAASR